MKIVILARKANEIKQDLDAMLPGNVISAYEDVHILHDYVYKTVLQANIMIVEDEGVASENNILQGFSDLMDILEYKFTNVEKVIFLNKPSNPQYLEKYKYIESVFKKLNEAPDRLIQLPDIVISTMEHTTMTVKSLILSFDTSYDVPSTDDVCVIQKPRKASVVRSKIIEEEQTDAEYYASFNKFDSSEIKSSFKGNTEPFPLNKVTPLDEIQVSSDEILSQKILKLKDKYLAITGVENSGVSTTSLVLANSATEFGKVLLIDLDIDNMGLSYLAEQLYMNKEEYSDKVNCIDLTQVIIEDYSTVEKQTYSTCPLHIMTIKLPLVDTLKDIEFLIINMLSLISDRYDYVLFDLPLRVLSHYPVLLSKFVDKLVITNIPYLNKTVSTLRQIRNSSIPYLTCYKKDKVVAFSIGMSDKNGLLPITKDIYKKYSNFILGKAVQCTGIFTLKSRDYFKPSIFKEIIDYNVKPEDYSYITRQVSDNLAEEQITVESVLGISQDNQVSNDTSNYNPYTGDDMMYTDTRVFKDEYPELIEEYISTSPTDKLSGFIPEHDRRGISEDYSKKVDIEYEDL